MSARRAFALAIVLVASVLFVATLHELRTGARAIDDSDAALARGDRAAAIAEARVAAEAVVLGSPYPERGYERLHAIAKDAEARGDDETSANAWAAMRAASLETRGLGVHTNEWLRLANEGIARVGSGAWAGPDSAKLKTDVRASEQSMLEALHRQETPPTTTFVLLALGAAGFFGGVTRIAWNARPDKPTSWRTERWSVAALAIGLLLYAIACLRS